MLEEDLDPERARATEELARLFAEDRLLKLLPSVVSVLDRNYRFLYLSAPQAAMASGKSALLFIPEAHQAAYREAFDRSWNTGKAETIYLYTSNDAWWEVQFTPQARDGSTFMMLAMT